MGLGVRHAGYSLLLPSWLTAQRHPVTHGCGGNVTIIVTKQKGLPPTQLLGSWGCVAIQSWPTPTRIGTTTATTLSNSTMGFQPQLAGNVAYHE